MSVLIAVVYSSGYGHTARLADAAGDGARLVPGVDVRVIAVEEITETTWSALDEADAMIWGSATYMGDVSAAFREFAEKSSKRWLNLDWRDKLCAGFVNSANKGGDKLHALQSLAILAAQHGMIWISLGLPAGWSHSGASEDDLNRLGFWMGAAGATNIDAPPEAMSEADLSTARHLGQRVAQHTRIFVAGRSALGDA